MKQLKANNFDQALKEMKSLDNQLAENFEGNINECDAKMYHIMTVTIEQRPDQVKNNVVTNIVQLHKHGFERFKKNFVFQGITKLIVVHDPSLEKQENVKIIPTHQKESIEAKVKRELKAKHDAEIAEAIQKQIEDAKSPQNAPEEENIDEMIEIYNEVIENGKKADLIAFGVEYGIEGIEGAKDNDARKEILKNWFEQI